MYYFHLLEMSSQNKDSLHSSRKDLQNLIYRTSTVSQTGNKPHSHSQFTPNVFTDGAGGWVFIPFLLGYPYLSFPPYLEFLNYFSKFKMMFDHICTHINSIPTD